MWHALSPSFMLALQSESFSDERHVPNYLTDKNARRKEFLSLVTNKYSSFVTVATRMPFVMDIVDAVEVSKRILFWFLLPSHWRSFLILVYFYICYLWDDKFHFFSGCLYMHGSKVAFTINPRSSAFRKKSTTSRAWSPSPWSEFNKAKALNGTVFKNLGLRSLSVFHLLILNYWTVGEWTLSFVSKISLVYFYTILGKGEQQYKRTKSFKTLYTMALIVNAKINMLFSEHLLFFLEIKN